VTGSAGSYSINADVSLTKLGEYLGLPSTVDGDQVPGDFGVGAVRPASM
jgi:hypothetical protein